MFNVPLDTLYMHTLICVSRSESLAVTKWCLTSYSTLYTCTPYIGACAILLCKVYVYVACNELRSPQACARSLGFLMDYGLLLLLYYCVAPPTGRRATNTNTYFTSHNKRPDQQKRHSWATICRFCYDSLTASVIYVSLSYFLTVF